MVGAEMASSYRLEQTYNQNAPLPPFIEDLAERILQEQPAIVGFSICYTQQVWISFCLAKTLKQRAKIPILFPILPKKNSTGSDEVPMVSVP